MKQLKTMGYSALTLTLLCLTSSNGFLETDKNGATRNNDKLYDRNFFGNTWQRFSGTLQERRDIRENKLSKLLPEDDSRFLDGVRRREVREDRQIENIDQERRILADRESRFRHLNDRRDNRRDMSLARIERDSRRFTRENVSRRKSQNVSERRDIRTDTLETTRNNLTPNGQELHQARSRILDNSRRQISDRIRDNINAQNNNYRRQEIRSSDRSSRIFDNSRREMSNNERDIRSTSDRARQEIRRNIDNNRQREVRNLRENEQEIRSVSAEDRIAIKRLSPILSTNTRREIRSTSPSESRKNDRQSRRNVRLSSSEKMFQREADQKSRRDLQDRSRDFDNSRLLVSRISRESDEDDHQSRQADQQSRQDLHDRSRYIDSSRRLSASRDQERSSRPTGRNNQESRLLTRREIRSASSSESRENSRQVSRREVRLASSTGRSREIDIYRQREAGRDSRQDLNDRSRYFDTSRRLSALRDQERLSRATSKSNQESRLLTRREIRFASPSESRENNRQVSRREVRLDSSAGRSREIGIHRQRESRRDLNDRSRYFDNSRRLSVSRDQERSPHVTSESNQESRLLTRREIRFTSPSESREDSRQSREVSRRDVRLPTSARMSREIDIRRQQEADRESRQDLHDRFRNFDGFRRFRAIDKSSRESRQLIRREIRSLTPNENREDFHSSRQISRRDIRLVSSARMSREIESLRQREVDQESVQENRNFDNSRRLFTSRQHERSRNVREDIRETRQDERRENRSLMLDRIQDSRRFSVAREDIVDSDRERLITRSALKNRQENNSRQREQDLRQIRILDRRLIREESNRVNDKSRRISVSSKNDNSHLYSARKVVQRQSKPEERRTATSFNTDVTYIPETKSKMLFNAIQIVLLTFLVVQGINSSSKTKKNWLQHFVTVTKEKVL